MSFELKRKEIELMKVKCAREEMKLKILERLEDVRRIEDNVKLQEEKIRSLEEELEKGEREDV